MEHEHVSSLVQTARGDLPFETDVISHGTDREIGNQVHVPSVHLVDQVDPLLHGTEVRVKQGEIDNGIT